MLPFWYSNFSNVSGTAYSPVSSQSAIAFIPPFSTRTMTGMDWHPATSPAMVGFQKIVWLSYVAPHHYIADNKFTLLVLILIMS
jgi:hypothetical protein